MDCNEKYQNRINYLRKRYGAYDYPLPDKVLVENDKFICPSCYKERDILEHNVFYQNGRTINSRSHVHGKIISTVKQVEQIPFMMCTECVKILEKRDNSKKLDKIALISLIITICCWIVSVVLFEIKKNDFNFFVSLIVIPFIFAIPWAILFGAVNKVLTDVFMFPGAKYPEDISLWEAAKGNALV